MDMISVGTLPLLTIEDLECRVWNSFSGFGATVSSVTMCTVVALSFVGLNGKFRTTEHVSLFVLTCSCFCDEALDS